jgi:hypothetical protein
MQRVELVFVFRLLLPDSLGTFQQGIKAIDDIAQTAERLRILTSRRVQISVRSLLGQRRPWIKSCDRSPDAPFYSCEEPIVAFLPSFNVMRLQMVGFIKSGFAWPPQPKSGRTDRIATSSNAKDPTKKDAPLALVALLRSQKTSNPLLFNVAGAPTNNAHSLKKADVGGLKHGGAGASKDYYHKDGSKYGYLAFKSNANVHQGGPENDIRALNYLEEIGLDSIVPKIDKDTPAPSKGMNGYWIEHFDVALEFKANELVSKKTSAQKDAVAFSEIKSELEKLDKDGKERALGDLKLLSAHLDEISDKLAELSIVLTKDGRFRLIDFGLASNKIDSIKNKKGGEYYIKTKVKFDKLYKLSQEEANAHASPDGVAGPADKLSTKSKPDEKQFSDLDSNIPSPRVSERGNKLKGTEVTGPKVLATPRETLINSARQSSLTRLRTL